LPLTEPQRQVAKDDSRFKVLITGRRFGKTHLCIRELCKNAAQNPKSVNWLVAPSYRMAKQLVWLPLLDKLGSLRWIKKKNESELTIILKNNSIIALRGADNADSLRGVGLDFLVMDEFQDIPKEAFTEVLRPTLSDKQGRALFTGTPKGYGSWSHELFTTALRTEGWNAWQFSTIEGGNVPESEIEAARRDLDERTFQQEYEAKFSNYGGVVAYNFDYKQSVRALEKPNLDMIHVGIDFNITPGTCSIATVFGDTVHFFDEIHMANSNTDMLAEELKTRYPHSKIVVYPDPSGRRKGTSSGGRSDLSILQNAGFIVKARPRHTPIKDRVNAFNARLKNTKGERKCFFDPKCKHIIDSVGRLSYIEGTSQIDKDSGLDHQFDSVTYLVDYIWPIRTVYEVDEPQRWAFGGGQRW
jgi:hypothetical protein